MSNAEYLFEVIGGVDPALLARSEGPRRRDRWTWAVAAAACLALLLAAVRVTPWEGEQPEDGSGDRDTAAIQDLEDGRGYFPEGGGEIGTLHLLRCDTETAGTAEEAVDILLYVNEERFTVEEDEGLYRVRSADPLPEDFPVCGLDILRLPGIAPEEAWAEVESGLGAEYGDVTCEDGAAVLPGSLYLRAGESLDTLDPADFWRAKQAEFWFVADGKGGSFVLSARYFLEAEEGLGAQFRDMVSGFRVVDLTQAVPDWMRELYTAVDRLSPALFQNDLTGVSDLLTEGAGADAYDENVWPWVSIISVDYTLDNDQDPAQATVSVKHRLNEAEGDSFGFLTMSLIRRNGSWYLEWSGVEK